MVSFYRGMVRVGLGGLHGTYSRGCLVERKNRWQHQKKILDMRLEAYLHL